MEQPRLGTPLLPRLARLGTPTERPRAFPRFEIGGHGQTSQAREMLWELKRTSPFHRYEYEPLPEQPLGLSPREYVEIWADTARPEDWVALATALLHNMQEGR